jgi:hypothetical protein
MEYSPELSIATAVFELAATVWAIRQAGDQRVIRTVAALLVILAAYQLCELGVCAAPEEALFSRLAFAVIVWLPPLGLRLLVLLSEPVRSWPKRAVQASFPIAGVLAVWVMVDPGFVIGAVCQAVIAGFTHPTPYYDVYGVSYELGLLGIVFGSAVAMIRCPDQKRRAHIADLQMGILGFLIPALLTAVVVPEAYEALPSVMCHYSLILGVLLVRLVARERRSAVS